MATAFQIETGVPIPPKNRLGAKPKYPWVELEVGQSFFVQKPPKYFRPMIAHAARLHRRQFTYSSADGGIRVWRIA